MSAADKNAAIGVAQAKIAKATDKLHAWARSFPGLQSSLAVISSPPTVSVSTGTTSQVDGTKVGGAVSYAWNSASISVAGQDIVLGSQGGIGKHITGVDGTKTGGSTPFRRRFVTDAPKLDICLYEGQSSRVNLVVDGQIAHTEFKYAPIAFNNYRYLQYDFGANTDAFGFASDTPSIAAGGAGHAVGDIVTMDGGSGAVSGAGLTVRVRTVNAGAVTAVTPLYRGAYASLPANNFSQVSTTGTGTGLQLAFSAYSNYGSTRNVKRIELVWFGGLEFKGLVVPSGYRVFPDPVPTSLPKLCVIGDSLMAGTYLGYAGGHIGYHIAQRLGLYDNVIISAQGGTGWNVDSGNAARWSHANRVQDFIDYDADIYLFIGSQNDGSASTTLQNKVRDTIAAVSAARPDAYFVGIGPVVGSGATAIALSQSIRDGFLAGAAAERVRFIENVSEQWIPTSNAWMAAGDGNHMHQYGQEQWAKTAASRVAAQLIDMAFAA